MRCPYCFLVMHETVDLVHKIERRLSLIRVSIEAVDRWVTLQPIDLNYPVVPLLSILVGC